MYSETSETFASLFGSQSTVLFATVLQKRLRCHFVSCDSCRLLGEILPLVSRLEEQFHSGPEELKVVLSISSGCRVLTIEHFLLSARVATLQWWLVFYKHGFRKCVIMAETEILFKTKRSKKNHTLNPCQS